MLHTSKENIYWLTYNKFTEFYTTHKFLQKSVVENEIKIFLITVQVYGTSPILEKKVTLIPGLLIKESG